MKKKEICDHELIPLLRSFTSEEIKKFGLYLRSPYFSKRKALSGLYSELVKYHPLYTHIRLTKELLYKKIYGNKEYKDSTMRDLFAEIINSAKDFLAHESFSSDNLYTVHLLRQLRLRNQHHLFSNQIKQTNLLLENYKGIDPAFFMLKYHLDAEKYNENVMFQKLNTAKSFIRQAKQITDSGVNLLIYSILEIVSGYIILLMRADKSKVTQIDRFMTNAVNSLALKKTYESIKGKSEYDFIVEIYDHLLSAVLKRGNWQVYNDYKQKVLDNLEKIGHNEASDLYAHMIKISILGTFNDETGHLFNIELLDIYDTYLRKKYFRVKKSKYIPSDLYRAIIFHAVKMKSLGWLNGLINDSGPWLNPETRESLLNYAKANYYFAAGDYHSALNSINKIEIEYYLFKYDLYVLKLKTFFESGDYEFALDLILSFRQFISYDKLMHDDRKVLFHNFTKFLEKIIRISINSSNTDADSLLLKFQKTKNVIYSDWLLEKIQGLQSIKTRYSRSV